MGTKKKVLRGFIIIGLLGGLLLPAGHKASAETVYSYKDEASSFAVNGGNVKIAGEHVVWRGKASDGSGPAGQIHYGNRKKGQTIAVTSHRKLTDSPAVGVNLSGEPVVVWADKRDYNEETPNFNWDIYTST